MKKKILFFLYTENVEKKNCYVNKYHCIISRECFSEMPSHLVRGGLNKKKSHNSMYLRELCTTTLYCSLNIYLSFIQKNAFYSPPCCIHTILTRSIKWVKGSNKKKKFTIFLCIWMDHRFCRLWINADIENSFFFRCVLCVNGGKRALAAVFFRLLFFCYCCASSLDCWMWNWGKVLRLILGCNFWWYFVKLRLDWGLIVEESKYHVQKLKADLDFVRIT